MKDASTIDAPHIGLLVDTSTEWGRRLVRGVLKYAGIHGPWYTYVTPRGRGERPVLPDGWLGDGVIARITDVQLLRRLQAMNVPVVNTSAVEIEAAAIPTVCSDLAAAAHMAVDYFLNRGFRHFAYAGPCHLSYVQTQRDAYVQALAAKGLTCHIMPPIRRQAGRTQYENRLEQIGQWVENLPHPVALFSWAIAAGLEVLQVCRERGIGVPHDVAVLGSDEDALLCEASHPPLSGVLTGSEQVGFEAAAWLDRLMAGEKPKTLRQTVKPIEVVSRPSTDTLAVEDPEVRAVLEFIDQRALDPIQMDDILKAVPVARRTIERKFQQYLNRTPTEEIRRRRLAAAQGLLARTNMAMPDIAVAVGYATHNYLNHLFKQEYGLTLGQYRKRVRMG